MLKPIEKLFTAFIPALSIFVLMVAMPACSNADKSNSVSASGAKTKAEEPSVVHASGATTKTDKHLSGATTQEE